MGLENILDSSLVEPEVSDLVYLALDGEEAIELGRRSGYLYNPEPSRLLAGLLSVVERYSVRFCVTAWLTLYQQIMVSDLLHVVGVLYRDVVWLMLVALPWLLSASLV